MGYSWFDGLTMSELALLRPVYPYVSDK